MVCSVCKDETTGGQGTIVPCSRQEEGASTENKEHHMHVHLVKWVAQGPRLGGVLERQHKISRGTPATTSLNNNAGGGSPEFGCSIGSRVGRSQMQSFGQRSVMSNAILRTEVSYVKCFGHVNSANLNIHAFHKYVCRCMHAPTRLNVGHAMQTNFFCNRFSQQCQLRPTILKHVYVGGLISNCTTTMPSLTCLRPISADKPHKDNGNFSFVGKVNG